MDNFQISNNNNNNSTDYPLNTTTTLLEPTVESELKKLLENKNRARDLKLDKISFLSKNIQSIGNGIPLIFCNITRLYLSNNNIISLEGIEQFANLTHLSISYNLIEDIYELNHIINPEILLHLNVKGNFFCKNPSYEEVIMNLFINLKTLDDFKINNSHKKMIKAGADLSKLIMIFLLDIDEKIEKINNIKNVCDLNSEYNLINSSQNNLQQFNNDNISSLIEEFNNIDEISIGKILSLINEKKVSNNNHYLPNINELNNLILQYLNNTKDNLITSEESKMKNIYSSLFYNLILNQRRKDYRGFLNYLIMTSEPKLLEFIKKKIDNSKYIENEKTSINILCQNFEKILLKYSDYSIENINEIQMMIFSLYFNGNNIISNSENDIQIIIDQEIGVEKIILNNYEQKIINFRQIAPNYFPIFPLDEEFMKNFMNYLKEKIMIFIKYINEMKLIKHNNKLNKKNNFMENYEEETEEKKGDLNNNDMNNYEENENNDELVNINNNNNLHMEKDIQNIQDLKQSNEYNIYRNINTENDKINQNEDSNEYNLNEPFIYNSQNNFYNKNKNNNEENKNIFIQVNNENINTKEKKENIKELKTLNYINNNRNVIKNIQSNTAPNIKINQEKIQMKYNIIQLNKILNNILYNNNLNKSKSNFIKCLRAKQYLNKINQIYNALLDLLSKHKIKAFFTRIKKYKSKSKSKSKDKNRNKYKNEETEENNELNKRALIFYYNNLKKKFYRIFKYNHFCKKDYLNINEIKLDKKNNIKINSNNINENNDSINHDIYNFFHCDNKLANNNNKINIDNHNNSININNINSINNNKISNLSEKDKSQNKYIIDYTKDKNYNNALKLRKILENEKEIIKEEKTEETNLNNIDNNINNNINIQSKNEVDELLNSLKNLYKEIDEKSTKTNSNAKSTQKNEYDKKNKEYINRLREVREKERLKAKKKYKKVNYDENRILGCPNFTKNTYSSVLKNIY